MLSAKYIENMLIESHLVREVCVLPAPNDDMEYQYWAFVVPMQNTSSEIYGCLEQLNALLLGVSVRIEFLNELPKSSMGRVSLDALRSLNNTFCA